MSYIDAMMNLATLLDLDVVSHCQIEPQLKMLERFSSEETVGRIIANKIQLFAGRALEHGHHDVAELLSHWHQQKFALAA